MQILQGKPGRFSFVGGCFGGNKGKDCFFNMNYFDKNLANIFHDCKIQKFVILCK